jgi:hypothetical protein
VTERERVRQRAKKTDSNIASLCRNLHPLKKGPKSLEYILELSVYTQTVHLALSEMPILSSCMHFSQGLGRLLSTVASAHKYTLT